MTTQQMIDAIRKGDRLGHATMQKIADELVALKVESESGWHLARDAARGLGVECDIDLGHKAEQMNKECERLRAALGKIYQDDQHPNYDDPTTPIIGSAGTVAWKALNYTENGGFVGND
tara:strand:- start:863 stop:1219 length:357 start_codon:yes stop_codon:yes gene_type:complete